MVDTNKVEQSLQFYKSYYKLTLKWLADELSQEDEDDTTVEVLQESMVHILALIHVLEWVLASDATPLYSHDELVELNRLQAVYDHTHAVHIPVKPID